MSQMRRLVKEIDGFLSDLGLVEKSWSSRFVRVLQDLLLEEFNYFAKESIKEAIEYLESGNGNISKEEIKKIIANLEQNLGKSFSEAMRFRIKTLISDVYYKSQEINIGYMTTVSQKDIEAIYWLRSDSVYWIGEYYNTQLSGRIKKLGDEIISTGLSRDEAAKVFSQALSEQFKKTRAYWEGMANHVVTRASTFGTIEGMRKAGIKRYQIHAVIDDRTSEICRYMNGYVFEVEDGIKLRDKLMNAKTPEEIKRIAPWRKVEDVKDKKRMPLGMRLPPYHFNCRTVIVPL